MTIIKPSWKPEIVLLSYGLSVLGCLVGVYLSEQFRLRSFEGRGILKPNHILMLMSISIGGIGVWAMHFTGMQALVLRDQSSGKTYTLGYDILLTVTSLVAVILCTFIGLYISSRDRVYMKNSTGVAEMLLEDGKNLSIQQVRDKSKLRNLAIFKGLHSLVYGGVVIGTGICVMHYLGMKAQVGDIRMMWQGGVIFASLIIAVVVATVALWIIFRLLSLYPRIELLRVASAAVMGVAACGMHYTGMYGAVYEVEANGSVSVSHTIDGNTAGTSGLAAGLLVSIVCIMLVIADLRAFYHHANNLLSKYETIVHEMEAAQSPGVAPFVERFRTIKTTYVSQGLSLGKTGGLARPRSLIGSKANNVRVYNVEERGEGVDSQDNSAADV